MINMPPCPECGVPELVTQTHTWLSNGTIILNANPLIRLIIHESQNMDQLFAGIANILGKPVEPIIVDATRRASRVYMTSIIPEDTEERLKAGKTSLHDVGEMLVLYARALGYGNVSVVDGRYKGEGNDFMVIRYAEPYSVPLMDGNIAGCVEAVVHHEVIIEHKQISAESHEVRLTVPGPQAGAESIQVKLSSATGGNIELKRCPACGGPVALSDYRWDVERGLISMESTGRRVSILGPIVLDPLFQELESELGEDVPAVVIEAQRRFVRGGMYSVSEVRSESQMREFFALRGLGDIRELKIGRKGVLFKVDNALMHLMIVGQVQGMYEHAFGTESRVEWEFNKEGTLVVEVSPWD